jgi:hypothetical protein
LTFDTLKLAKGLERARLSRDQAEAIVDAFAKVRMTLQFRVGRWLDQTWNRCRVERSEERWWCAELHRLRGVFLATIDADETQIEASFCAAISTAKQQKSTSLAMRAEASHAEYRSRKAARS